MVASAAGNIEILLLYYVKLHTRTSDLSCLQNEHEMANFFYCGEEAHDSGNREKDACKSMQIKCLHV